MKDAPKLLLPWWGCGLVILVAITFSVVQVVVADLLAKDATTRTVKCEAAYAASNEDRGVVLALDCGASKHTVKDSKVILSHIPNPGPLTCRIANKADGKPTLIGCDPRT